MVIYRERLGIARRGSPGGPLLIEYIYIYIYVCIVRPSVPSCPSRLSPSSSSVRPSRRPFRRRRLSSVRPPHLSRRHRRRPVSSVRPVIRSVVGVRPSARPVARPSNHYLHNVVQNTSDHIRYCKYQFGKGFLESMCKNSRVIRYTTQNLDCI